MTHRITARPLPGWKREGDCDVCGRSYLAGCLRRPEDDLNERFHLCDTCRECCKAAQEQRLALHIANHHNTHDVVRLSDAHDGSTVARCLRCNVEIAVELRTLPGEPSRTQTCEF